MDEFDSDCEPNCWGAAASGQRARYHSGMDAAPVEELTPAPDPWDVFSRLASLRHVLFLDSALSHEDLGRYSFVTADPFDWLRSLVHGDCPHASRFTGRSS